MGSSIWQRFRGQLPIVALGLATPLLALTALVVRPGGEPRREVVTVASDRAPTPTPVPRSGPTTSVVSLTPPSSGGLPTGDGGSSAGNDSSAGSATDGVDPRPSRPDDADRASSRTAPTSKRTTSTKPSSPGSVGTGGTSTAGSGGSGTGSGGSGSGSGGSSGGGGGSSGSGGPTTTAPPSNVVFADAMSYTGSWTAGQVFGPWTVRTDGGGGVSGSGGTVTLQPAVPDAGERNSVIVTAGNFADLDLTVVLSTVSVLPNGGGPTDVAGIVWHYVDSTRHYLFRAGPGGWAVVLVDPGEAGGRRNLAEGSSPAPGLGANVTVRIRQVGPTISAYVGGTLVAVVNDATHSAGAIGLIATNSVGRFDQVTVRST